MRKGQHIRCFDYVNHRYAQVRDSLKANPLAVFQHATTSAAARAHAVASHLHANIAGLDVGKEVEIVAGPLEESTMGPSSSPVTRLHLEWKASESAGLFPTMHADLSVYPLTATETQLDFSGHYEPPLGPLGTAVDALMGHRIAEASVHRFVSDVANHLRKALV